MKLSSLVVRLSTLVFLCGQLGNAAAQSPTITSFNPESAVAGSPIFVDINVENPGVVDQIAFGGVTSPQWALLEFDGQTYRYQAALPANAVTGPITVRNTAGQLGVSETNFTIFNQGPMPTSFSPTSGIPGTHVTINGTQFYAGTQAFFLSSEEDVTYVEAPIVTHVLETRMVVQVPETADSGPILMTNSLGQNTTTQEFQVVKDVDLAVNAVTDHPTGVVDSALTYQVTATNLGDGPASGVVVTIVLDETLTYFSSGSSQGGTSHSSGTVTAILGNIPDGGSATANVVVIPTTAKTVATTVEITGNEDDPEEGNNAVTVETVINGQATDLQLSMVSEPESVAASEAMTYVIGITNAGPGGATGVTLVNTLPSAVTFLTASSTQGTFTVNGRTVTLNAGQMAVDAVVTFRINVLTTSVTPFTNTATVSGQERDPDSSNDTASLTTELQELEADLSVSQVLAQTPAVVGQETKLLVTVMNNGPNVARDVKLVGTLSADTLYVGSTTSSGTIDLAGQLLVGQFGDVSSGGKVDVMLTVIPKDDVSITNIVEVSAQESDPVPGNNRSVFPFTPVVQDPPVDIIRRDDGMLVISWPAFPDIYKLIFVDEIGSVRWGDVLTAPTEDGGRFSVVLPIEEDQLYYRLTTR